MFFEEGWAALSDITREVRDRVEVFYAEHARQSGAEMASEARLAADTALTVWEFCDAATKAGVTGGNGALIPASKALLAWDDPRKPYNKHVHLEWGSVGSAPGLDAEGRANYGPFLYLQLAVPLNGVQSSMSFLEEELRQGLTPDPEVKKIAVEIVRAVDGGEFINRTIARNRFAANLSRRAFKLCWSMAADARPALWETTA